MISKPDSPVRYENDDNILYFATGGGENRQCMGCNACKLLSICQMGIAGVKLAERAVRNQLDEYEVYGGEEFTFNTNTGKLIVSANHGTGDDTITREIEFGVLFGQNGFPICPELIHKFPPESKHNHQAYIFCKI